MAASARATTTTGHVTGASVAADPGLRRRAGIAVVHGTGAVLNLGLQLLIARLLKVQGYGAYATVIVTVQLLALPGKAGLDVSAVRFIGRTSSPLERRAFFEFGRASVLVCSGSAAILMAAIAWVGNVPHRTGFVLGGVLLVAYCMEWFLQGVLRGLHRPLMAAMGTAVIQTALELVLATGVALALRDGSISSATMVGLEAGSFAVVSAGLYMICHRHLRVPEGQQGDTASTRARERRSWRATSARLSVYGTFAIIIGQLDVLIASGLFGAAAAGRYSLAWKLATIVGFMLFVTSFSSAGTMARLWTTGHIDDLQLLVRRDCRIVMVLSTVALVAVVVGSPVVLERLGDGFGSSRSIVVVLAVAQWLSAMGGPAANILSMTGHEKALLSCVGTAAGVNLVGSFSLAWAFGATGIAYGTLLACFTMTVLFITSVRRSTRLAVGPLAVFAVA